MRLPLEDLDGNLDARVSIYASLGLWCDIVGCPLGPDHVAGAPEKCKHCYERESDPLHNDLLGYRFHVASLLNVPNDRWAPSDGDQKTIRGSL